MNEGHCYLCCRETLLAVRRWGWSKGIPVCPPCVKSYGIRL